MSEEESEALVKSTYGEPIEVWEPPNKAFVKKILVKGIGFDSPLHGCTCYLKVISDELGLFQPLDDESIKEFVVGEADNEVDKVIEVCLLSMKEEEICELNFSLSTASYSEKCAKRKRPSQDHDETGPRLSFSEEIVPEEEHEDETTLENKKIDMASPHAEVTALADDASRNAKDPSETPKDDAGESSDESEVIRDNVVLKFQLVMFTSEPDIWEMSITEKWRRACHHKKKGIELFAQKQVYWAFRRFSKALKYLISLEYDIPEDHPEQGMDIQSLKLSCYLNLAACQLKHSQYDYVVKNCTKALEIDSTNSKALFRRGVAYLNRQDYELAQEDLDKAAALEPNNQAIAHQQRILKIRVQKLNNYCATAMKKMFA